MIADGNSHCLSWERRIQIAIDAAEGQYNFTFEEAKSAFLQILLSSSDFKINKRIMVSLLFLNFILEKNLV